MWTVDIPSSYLESWTKHLQEIDNEDVDAFTEAVKAYDSISRLDSWHTTLLLKVKKTINDGDLT